MAMFYHIETEESSAGGKTGTVYTLTHGSGASVEIWPAHGFNCLRWRVGTDAGPRDLLYCAPDWEANPVPTRSGIPILFPFPGRIRDGKYNFGWKDYQLPLNDSTKANAIHGFAPHHAWSVFGYSLESDCAWIHGDFQGSLDAPETTGLWPADYIISVIYRFTEKSLRLETRVTNVCEGPLPFGLGFHPYFRFPCPDETIDRCQLLAPARSIWDCVDSIPTGERSPIPDQLNWNTTRRIGDVQLDNLYTGLGAIAARPDGMLLRAALGHAEFPGSLQVWTTGDFRELVLYTPPHRRAVCIEPYTCAADAVNLAKRKIDAGWKVLQPGEMWAGAIELRWDATSDV